MSGGNIPAKVKWMSEACSLLNIISMMTLRSGSNLSFAMKYRLGVQIAFGKTSESWLSRLSWLSGNSKCGRSRKAL
jgi:hypothetical protein